MQRWEYCVRGQNEWGGFAKLSKILNDFGQEGWELLGEIDGKLVFKRPMDNDDAEDTVTPQR